MIEIDDRRWPIVVANLRDRFTLADAAAYVAAFDRFFERGEPFAVAIVYADEIAAGDDREIGAAPLMARWLKANHGLVTERCRGICAVVPFPDIRAAMADQIAGVGRAFGCPVTLVATRSGAEGWLGDRIASASAKATMAAEREVGG